MVVDITHRIKYTRCIDSLAMQPIDLRDVSNGDWLAITLTDGETFRGMVVDYEHVQRDVYEQDSVRFAFEGDLWDQVQDRVDSEVLNVTQRFARKTGKPKKAVVHGHIMPDETSFEYKKLGEVDSVQEIQEAEV
jgi:hypothetical protein